MVDYSGLLAEMGFARRTKPVPIRKALADQARKIASAKRTLASLARIESVDDLAARRARCAELNEKATMLAKAGELTAEQGAALDIMLHRHAVENGL